MEKLELDLSPSAIAGLVDPEAEMFEDYKDPRLRCSPVSHAWTPTGDILIGSEQGQLLRVSTNVNFVNNVANYDSLVKL